jgi:hypothetical protein
LARELQREQARSRQLEQEAANLRAVGKSGSSSLLGGQLPATLVAVALIPGRQRDFGAGKTVHIPAGTDFVQLNLKMQSLDYPLYQATLQNADDSHTILTQILSRTESSVQESSLQLSVSAVALKRGDYFIKLRGMTADGEIEDVDTYYLRITPKK